MNEYKFNSPRQATIVKTFLFSLFCLCLSLISALFFDGIYFTSQATWANVIFLLSVPGMLIPWLIFFVEPTLTFSGNTIKVQSWANQLLKINHYKTYPLQDIKVGRMGGGGEYAYWKCLVTLYDFKKSKKSIVFFNYLSKSDLLAELKEGYLNIKIGEEKGFGE